MTEKKIFLIDGNSQAYQAYYAIKTPFTSPDGKPTNAVYGFTLMLQKIIREKKPDYLAVAFDTPAPTFRHKAYEEYKAHRKPMPDELAAQLGMMREVLEGYRIPVFAVDGYEADDVLGTLAVKSAAEGLTAYIVTRDKDALQLLGERVFTWDNKTDKFYGPEELAADKEITPDQVVDMMALSGDSTDNVPGIPGVGPKTALGLIQKYGTLEEVLSHADEVKGKKLGENLRLHADSARMSKELVTIDTNVPLDIDFDSIRLCDGDHEALTALFRKLGFKSLLSTVAETSADSAADYTAISDEDGLVRLVGELQKAASFAFDVETTGLSAIDSRLVGMSFAFREGEAFYVPLICPLGEKCLDTAKVLAAVKPFLEDENRKKTGQNLKFDYLAMLQAGIEVRGIDFDTMVAAYVVDSGRRRYGLDDLAADYLSYKMIPISDLIGKGKKQVTLDTVSTDAVSRYACEDADIALRLAARLKGELKKLDDKNLFEKLEMPLVTVLARMEATGVKIDTGHLDAMAGEFEADIAALEEKIHKEAGHQFNISSTKQLAVVLFEERKLPAQKRTKTGFSTDTGVLEGLAELDPLARMVLDYRSLTKLKSTYLDSLPKMVSPKTGRVHGSFNQTGTATGRLSSSDPNLQNIPVRTEAGRRIRSAFVTEPGWVMLAADYSQIELRIAAHLSGDEALIEAFAAGEDIHNFVAREIYGVEDEDVTSEMRRTAKAVNFGIIYGQSPYGLSRQLGIPIGEAAEFIDSYFSRYPGVEKYIVEALEAARENGFVSTILGRRRYLSGITAASPRNLNASERIAINTTFQGSAADLIKVAMLDIDRRIRETGSPARMIMQIHDELVFEMPGEVLGQEKPLIESAMVNALELSVPVVVHIASGPNWLEAGG